MTNPRHHTPESLTNGLRAIRLSKIQKSEIRDQLVAYADLHSVQVRRSIISPLTYWRMGAVFAVAVLMIGTSVGVSYAAEDTLPGQPLYGVKVAVVEPIQGVLIPTQKGKAAWENVLAERRLAEASTLAAQDKLTASTTIYIEQQVAFHAANSERDAVALAASGKTGDALAVRSDLEARLSAHTTLLATLAPRLAASGEASSTEHVAMLYSKVKTAQSSAIAARVATEQEVTESSRPSQKVTATIAITADTREHEEASLFAKRASRILALVPVATSTATTSATTTLEVHTAATTSASVVPPSND